MQESPAECEWKKRNGETENKKRSSEKKVIYFHLSFCEVLFVYHLALVTVPMSHARHLPYTSYLYIPVSCTQKHCHPNACIWGSVWVRAKNEKQGKTKSKRHAMEYLYSLFSLTLTLFLDFACVLAHMSHELNYFTFHLWMWSVVIKNT